ncbi:S8 family serine peptidase [Lysobacter capsici]|uniref:S8 family serine peptidase n=1 Tax=Lysobacter capsici TaxID=435897 RepID=UPI000627EA99|nr:S8 family serine peptidase [Lysobacter capsici]
MTSRSNHITRLHLLAAATAVALTGLAAPAFAGQVYLGNLKNEGNQQFIVKYKSGSAPAASPASMSASLRLATSTAAMPAAGKRPTLRPLRQMIMPGGRVVASDRALDRAEAIALMRQIAADPNVEFVQLDGISKALMTPNDPSFAQQWHYADTAFGIRAPVAWNTSNGSGVVVAVIDSGILSHADLNANILPGYDFVSTTTGLPEAECREAGGQPGCGKSDDGDGRDANPLDSSNIVHGTHVAGTIGAVTNNGIGVAGVAFGGKVLPIRALGNQGFGSDSDIADAVVWASGGSISGVPANPNPAEIINLSLGGNVPCSQMPAWQAAVNLAAANGSTVIAAAGNSNNDVAGTTPAGCNNVISVAASSTTGSRASYSTWGATIDISAPGGNGSLFGGATDVISTLSNNGYGGMSGTSMAAPHAAGVAALILSASPTKTAAQIEQILESTARPIPANRCSGGCGAGIIDAAAAVAAAAGGTPGNQAPVANFSSAVNGLSVNFTDSSSDSDGSIASRSWSFGDGTTSTATNPSKTYAAAGTYTVTLTVTDNGGATNTKTSTVTVSGGGSGGVQTYSNTTDANIPDNNATGVSSSIVVSGRSGNAPSNAEVSVNIVHTYQGDLIVDLIAPDGSVYNLHSRTGQSTDNIVKTYTVNLSSEALNGTWRLRAADRAARDVGKIDSWSIKF